MCFFPHRALLASSDTSICHTLLQSACLPPPGVSSATHWTYPPAGFRWLQFYAGQETLFPLVLSCLVSVATFLLSVTQYILQSVCYCSNGCELGHSGLLPLFLLSSLPFFQFGESFALIYSQESLHLSPSTRWVSYSSVSLGGGSDYLGSP